MSPGLSAILGAVGALLLVAVGWLLGRRKPLAAAPPRTPITGDADEEPSPLPPITFEDPAPAPRPSRDAVDDHLRLIHSERTGAGPVQGEGDP